MRRDTQIGIILGIVILVIIGVFLSTRTSDTKTVLPDLVLSEGGREEAEIEEIDINELIKKSKEAEAEKAKAVVEEETSTVEQEHSPVESQIIEELVESTQPGEGPENVPVKTPEEDTSLKGKWEGVAEEIVEESQSIEKSQIAENFEVEAEINEGPITAQEILPSEQDDMPEKGLQIPSDSVPTDTIHKVKPNENLFKISTKYYGDGKKWAKIFEANKDSMLNPDALYVGQKLLIPDVGVEKEKNQDFQTPIEKNLRKKKYVDVDTHTVEAGDSLYRLAEKYYDDPSVWHKIYEANEETIEDKGLLKEGQILIIPKL